MKCFGYKQFKKDFENYVRARPTLGETFFDIYWMLHKIVECMDEKMRKQVGKPLKKAEKLVKKAEKNNAKLADYDEKVRDPLIAKAKKIKSKSR